MVCKPVTIVIDRIYMYRYRVRYLNTRDFSNHVEDDIIDFRTVFNNMTSLQENLKQIECKEEIRRCAFVVSHINNKENVTNCKALGAPRRIIKDMGEKI